MHTVVCLCTYFFVKNIMAQSKLICIIWNCAYESHTLRKGYISQKKPQSIRPTTSVSTTVCTRSYRAVLVHCKHGITLQYRHYYPPLAHHHHFAFEACTFTIIWAIPLPAECRKNVEIIYATLLPMPTSLWEHHGLVKRVAPHLHNMKLA